MTRSERTRFWGKHLARQRRGGLSCRAYCAKHGLAVSSFGYWSRKLRSVAPDRVDRARSPMLVPVQLLDAPRAQPMAGGCVPSGVQLHTGAVRIELAVEFDAPTLRRALQALGC